ncbi:MAG: UDP-N-acetylmuramoyl-L-alanine--D-glutamate ligase [Proteobacteria bacterium]|nr:UDP-N-acetylmuramoyl-L-alanine--D-glutamate ligase [Pseudomonadota bacterium]
MVAEPGGYKLVVGLGETGLSCARFLARKGERFKVVDSRLNPPALDEFRRLFPAVEYELGDFQVQTFMSAEQLIVSPGVSLLTPAIAAAMKNNVSVTGDIDIFSREVKRPIAAVTGSNGKSTVVELLAAILKSANVKYLLGGNLDGANFKPALDLLAEPPADIYILELSSFQLETTENLAAEVATILNLSEDHLDRYASLEDYKKAKQRIFNGCRHVVINRDDPASIPPATISVPSLDFGFSKPGVNGLGLLEENDDQYLAYQFEKIVSVSELKIVGQHNIANALAAIALALTLGVELDAIRRAVREFTGLPHRCQWVATINGVDFYNDSKGTNVGATMAAVEGLGQRISGHILLIAGGVSKGADFSPLAPVINRWAKEVILIGRDALELAATLDADIQTYFAEDMQDAVSVALEHASAGDAVLLSPACASFDMFDNYRHRGQVFVQSVERLQ